MSHSFLPLFVLLILPAILLFPGCGTNRVSVTKENGDVLLQDRSTNDSIKLGDNVTIPDDFPSDIPRYPGAITQFVTVVAQEHAHSMSQQTADDIPTVTAWIKQSLSTSGYTGINEFTESSVAMLGFEKGTISFQFQITRDNQQGKTNILTVRQEKMPQTP